MTTGEAPPRRAEHRAPRPEPSGSLARQQLERYLVSGSGAPSLSLLERSRLAGHAYAHGDDELRSDDTLRRAVQRLTMRHLHCTSVLVPLFRRCHHAGILVVPFKGFHLAEFVYDEPAARPYSDVDLLVDPTQVEDVVRLALEVGWRLRWERRSSLYRHSHEEAVLDREGVTLEVHRLALDCAAPNDAVQRRLSARAWERVQRVAWRGAEVGLLHPVDAALYGIVLARMWSGGDDLQVKPTDYLDLAVLGQRHGVDQAALTARARELGCERSLDAFLQRCSPWTGRVNLSAPSTVERRALYRTMRPERGDLGRERALGKLRRFPGTLVDVVRHAGLVARWAWRLRRDPDLHGIPSPRAGTEARPMSLRDKERIVRGVKWAARVATRGDACMVRSLALLEAFRRRGAETQLVTGRDHGGRWHAWISLEPYTLSDLDDVPDCTVTDVSVRYPALQ